MQPAPVPTRGAPSPLHPVPLRRYAAWSIAVVLLVLATRVPLASKYLFSWDAANFALALDAYSVPAHRPQPPGYPLYVAAAWLLRGVTGEANSAYVSLSILTSTVGAVLVLGLGWRLLGGMGAAVATALFLSSPNVWGHGLVAYPYAFLALIATAVAWITVEARWGSRDLTGLGAIILGLGAGTRPDLLLLIGPLWIFGACQRGWRTLAPGVALMTLGVLVWLLPMVMLSGGWSSYLAAAQIYGEYWGAPTATPAAYVYALQVQLDTLLGYLYQTAAPGFLLLAIYGMGRLLPPRVLGRRRAWTVLPLWVAPPLSFYTLVHIGNLGYLLSIVPALAIWAAAAAGALAGDIAGYVRRPRARGPLLASIATLATAAGAALFLLLPGPVSLREIRSVDRELQRGIALIQQYPAESTYVISFDRFRQYSFYLQRRRKLGHVRSALTLLDGNLTANRVTLDVPKGVHTVILPDLYENRSDQRTGLERVRLTRDADAFVARPRPGERLRLGYRYARIVPVDS